MVVRKPVITPLHHSYVRLAMEQASLSILQKANDLAAIALCASRT
jgi:hypothetical protein